MSYRNARGGGAGNSKPLSAKAAALLSELKAHGSAAQQGESKYVGGLVEAAERRKLASEVAFEKKILAEAQNENGAPTQTFVTKAYENKLESIGKEATVLLRGAEKVQVASTESLVSRAKVTEGATRSLAASVNAEDLEKRRFERRMARKAPVSRLNDEFIEAARKRARARLGLS